MHSRLILSISVSLLIVFAPIPRQPQRIGVIFVQKNLRMSEKCRIFVFRKEDKRYDTDITEHQQGKITTWPCRF